MAMGAMPNLLSSRYRTAFVTGASTGLGLAFTDMLLAQGVEVWGTSRNEVRLPTRKGFHSVQLELGNGAAAAEALHCAELLAGGFDIVINNAGYGVFGSFTHTDFSVWEEQWRAMLINTAQISQAALLGMRARGHGALVNISSLAGEFGLPYQAVYNSVKAGLSALNESLMCEMRGTGVCVIDFRPGDYLTEIERALRHPPQASGLNEESRQRMERVWVRFVKMMRSCPPPSHAAERLRRALRHGRSATVRSGPFFQAVVAPFLARFFSLSVRRRVQEWYFGL